MTMKAAPLVVLVGCVLLAAPSTVSAQSATASPPYPPAPPSAAPPGPPPVAGAPTAPMPPGPGAPAPPGYGAPYPPGAGPPTPYPYPYPYGPGAQPQPGTVAAPGQLPPQAAAAWGWNTACPPGCGPCKEFPGKLKYVEGQPIPPGYRLDTEITGQAVAAGSITLGALWMISLAAGIGLQDDENKSHSSTSSSPKDYAWPLVFPVVGPFIAMGTAHPEGPALSVLLLDGILQTGGLVTLIAGAAAKRDVLVWTGQQGAELRVDPVIGMSGAGFGLTAKY